MPTRRPTPKPTPAVDPRQALLRAAGAPRPQADTPPQALADLESLLRKQIAAYEQLGELLEASRAAMSDLRLGDLTTLTDRQAEARDTLVKLEKMRVALTARLSTDRSTTLADLAERYPARSKVLLGLREKLRAATADAQRRVKLAGGVAGGVLGHLNTAVRLLDESAGVRPVYDDDGTPVRRRTRAVVEAVA